MILRELWRRPRPFAWRQFREPRRSVSTRDSAVPFIPEPTPFVPDAATFLKLIGRGLSAHSSKFPTWRSLWTLSSKQLQEIGIEPPRTRKYLLAWRQRFCQGVIGPGGDCQHVVNGEAELRVVTAPVEPGGVPRYIAGDGKEGIPAIVKRVIVNRPLYSDNNGDTLDAQDVIVKTGLEIRGLRTIHSSYARPVEGTNGGVARLAVTEGMWEIKRGRKVDGGERRRDRVRARRLEEAQENEAQQ